MSAIQKTKKIASAWYLDAFFGDSVLAKEPEDLKDCRLLVLWGGEDIHPSIYGQPVVHAEAYGTAPSKRDEAEIALIKEANRLEIPILGVCRGAQLLCATGGGSLWQHVDNHAGRDHTFTFSMNGTVAKGNTNSFHHQMMRPSNKDEILGWSEPLSVFKYADDLKPVQDNGLEPEVVFFPNQKAVGVQGHPEWLPKTHFLNYVVQQAVFFKLGVSL